jgi:hypothetical protein
MTHNAARLLATGQVRAGLSLDAVRDVLYAYTSPELYEMLVLEGAWSLEAYGDFVHRGLRGQLLDP